MSCAPPCHPLHAKLSDGLALRAETPSEFIREVETQDGAVLLDIRQGLCLSMTPSATRIWRLLKLNQSPEQIADALATEFVDVSRERIYDDVLRYIADLTEKGLLLPAGQGSVRKQKYFDKLLLWAVGRHTRGKGTKPKASTPHFLMWKALSGLAAFDLFRFGNNFTRIRAVVQDWATAPAPPSPDVVERVYQAVNYACVWYPKRVLCLQRSVITTCLLRNCGIPAQMVMGAQKCPFKAHAWTEVDGQPVNERRDVRAVYLVWERC